MRGPESTEKESEAGVFLKPWGHVDTWTRVSGRCNGRKQPKLAQPGDGFTIREQGLY